MTESRLLFIDYLRGFIFALMAFDHALHAYGQEWGRFWFIQDFDRSVIADAFYLFDQSIIMPMIFFISGLNVLPSLERRGFLKYFKRRSIKLVLPFLFCIPFIVPLLSFPRYLLTIDASMDYITYWKDIFFFDKLQAGPLWVCYALFLYSFILVFLNNLVPSFIPWLGKKIYKAGLESPIRAIITIIFFNAFILGVSDLIWGAPWWFGFGKLFYLQGSRFLLYLFYFILGAGVRASSLLDHDSFMTDFSRKWPQWLFLMMITGIFYVGYAQLYFNDGAYNDDFRYSLHHFFMQGHSWMDIGSFITGLGWEILKTTIPWTGIRTSLHGILCLFQVLFLLSSFYRFLNKPRPGWHSLAFNCYAIFLTHEAIVIWLQYSFIYVDLPIFIKFLLVFIGGLGGAWILSEKFLMKIPLMRKILG